MQIFITNKDLKISAMELDDLRLNKQIVEINQILMTYVNEDVGHSHHPINIYYKSMQGINFLMTYNGYLCMEYYSRFNKIHQGQFTTLGIITYFKQINKTFKNDYDFKPAYIKGQKGVNQVIDKDDPYELYRKLLCEKWDNDIKLPKWTKRNVPLWYNMNRKEFNYER